MTCSGQFSLAARRSFARPPSILPPFGTLPAFRSIARWSHPQGMYVHCTHAAEPLATRPVLWVRWRADAWARRPRSSGDARIQAMTFRVLFVCTGNICRSPTAERLLQFALAERLDN